MATRAKAAAGTAADIDAGNTDSTAGDTSTETQETGVTAPPEDKAADSAATAVTDTGTPPQPEPPAETAAAEPASADPAPDAAQEPAAAQPSLAEQLEVLGLTIDQAGMVPLRMLTSMSGPSIDLARGNPHRCDPEEAIRLVQANFAEPA